MKLFGRKASLKINSSVGLDGVVTFFGAHHALKGEKYLSLEGLSVKLIPGPRDISPNCGTALRFDFRDKDMVEAIFNDRKVNFEQIVFYPV